MFDYFVWFCVVGCRINEILIRIGKDKRIVSQNGEKKRKGHGKIL